MRILVRLPNWLGDVVMSLSFIQELKREFPNSRIDVIVKEGLQEMLAPERNIHQIFTFSKKSYKGIAGLWTYGKNLAANKYDIYFSLPNSFSSALMGFATRSKVRIGYKNELRSFLLTHAYEKPKGLHRVEEYAALINKFVCKAPKQIIGPVMMREENKPEKYIVINLNSEAISRRMPVERGIELITLVKEKFRMPIRLIGSSNDIAHINQIVSKLSSLDNIEVLAGKTTLAELKEIVQHAYLMVSTDSGPAHIASASGVPLVVIFGAGDEFNTGPYHNSKAIVVRHGELPCEPCVSNTCRIAPLPVCLTELNFEKICIAIDKLLKLTNGSI